MREPEYALFPVADIIVGERHRKDLGDIDGLAANTSDRSAQSDRTGSKPGAGSRKAAL
jgi:hypothetical protein